MNTTSFSFRMLDHGETNSTAIRAHYKLLYVRILEMTQIIPKRIYTYNHQLPDWSILLTDKIAPVFCK